ncbi:MAG: CheY4 [Firmicutes bacterium]|nr:CheY4 [Bacillota bacterium]
MATFLICDDSLFMRRMLIKMIEENGHKLLAEASNGKEAVSKYLEHKPDIVTMDITMPELDGVSAVRQIIGGDPKARIVMVSAIGQQGVITEAIKAGALDFIVKPFQPEKVIDVIQKVLKK